MDSSRRLNPEHIERVKLLADASPFLNLLGVKLVELDKDYCRTEVVVTRDLLNAFGGIHGGAYAAMLDNASFVCIAAWTKMPVHHDTNVADRARWMRGWSHEGRAMERRYARAGLEDERGRILAPRHLEASAHIGRGPHGESRAAEVPRLIARPSRPCETVHAALLRCICLLPLYGGT
ncbi:MAG: PaaI family thioesterase [Slackia sp.]